MTDAAATMNSAATDHLPWFVVAPGQTDVLLNAAAIFLIVVVFSFGLVYLRLHALPDHVAHKGSKIQLQIVGVLTLIALFTHNNLFWIAALLLALIEIPDFGAPLRTMARALDRMAPPIPPEPAEEPTLSDEPPEPPPGPEHTEARA